MRETDECMGGDLDWEEIVRREQRGELDELGGGEEVIMPSIPPLPKMDRKPWGLGGPGKFVLPPKNGRYTIVGLADLHGKWRDQGLFNAALNALEWLEPDLVILMGDVFNFDVVSRWSAKQLAKMSPLDLKREIDSEIKDVHTGIFAPLRKTIGSTPMICVEGNHDDRLRQYLTDDLHDGWAEAQDWLGTHDWLDGYYNRAGVYVLEDFLARHGAYTSQYPAAKEYRERQVSGWSAHLHRVSQHAEPPWPEIGKRHTHTVLPCMCRLDANYGTGNAGFMRWHQGIGVLSADSKNHQDHLTDVGLYNGESLVIRGRVLYA